MQQVPTMTRRARTVLLAAATAAVTAPALAAPDANGYEWATITHPGNRPTNDAETAFPGDRFGAVDHEYRIATTEVTVGQWFEFVLAYEPYYVYPGAGNVAGIEFTGMSIRASFGVIEIMSGHSTERPTSMGWEYAARYCNWLHNDKAPGQWAFETGVYDTSTFTFNDDGSANHQRTRSPGARYWIPTFDEWVKAAYYDPDRYGDGIEGYWHYGNGSDTRPIGALAPDEGGEQNAGDIGDFRFPFDVGSFAPVQSPWGLMDVSGGVEEWTESTDPFLVLANRRITGGSGVFIEQTDGPFFADRLGTYSEGWINHGMAGRMGLRLASYNPCLADLTIPLGVLDIADLMAFLDLFQHASPTADLAEPFGILNFYDLVTYLVMFNKSCP
jgi:formylglycine-generating enzyme required for sulfatase activity